MNHSSQTLHRVMSETAPSCLQEQRLKFEGGTAGTQGSDGLRQNGNGVANDHSNGGGAHARRAESHFVWDNEGPRQPPEQVAGFNASGRPVSNREFYRFVVGARGYQQPELWASADLRLLKRDGRSCPATWTVHVRQLAHEE